MNDLIYIAKLPLISTLNSKVEWHWDLVLFGNIMTSKITVGQSTIEKPVVSIWSDREKVGNKRNFERVIVWNWF